MTNKETIIRFVIDYGRDKTMFIAYYDELEKFLYDSENQWLLQYMESDVLKLKDFDKVKPYRYFRKCVINNYHFNVFLLLYLQRRSQSNDKIFPGGVDRVITNHEYVTVGGDEQWD